MKLRERILALLRQRDYRPQNLKSLAHSLVLAGEDDTRVGKILFRQGGSAGVILNRKTDVSTDVGAPDEPDVQITSDDTGVALRGDKAAVKIPPQKSGFDFSCFRAIHAA